MTMTHDELVTRAAKWLRTTGGCKVVLSEFVSYASENPDGMGWSSLGSVLIECKVSRSDYLADKRKITRQRPEMCMGNFRFYMTPPGLVSCGELPEGWGLLEAHGKIVRVAKDAYGWGTSSRLNPSIKLGRHGLLDERKMMFSALRRMEIRGYLKHAQDPLGPVTRSTTGPELATYCPKCNGSGETPCLTVDSDLGYVSCKTCGGCTP